MFEKLLVVELSSVLAGPMVGLFFAELGARVLKIENKKSGGDVTRTWKSNTEQSDDISDYFTSVNFGKESVALDISNSDDYQILCNIIAKADILISNYQPDVAHKLQVDYQTISSLFPHIIYAQITGYGSEDTRAGYDAVIQAETGLMSMNGQPGTPPTKLPVALIDVLAAHHLKEGILVALLQRNITQQGLYIHVSLFDSALASLVNQATNYLQNNTVPLQSGSDHPNIAPYGTIFTTKDNQQIIFAVGTDMQFQSLCSILGIPEIAHNVLYAINQNRVQNRDTLRTILQQHVGEVSVSLLLEQCHQHKVPVGKINTVAEALELPAAKQMLQNNEGYRATTSVAFSHDRKELTRPPHFDEHGAAIRKEFETS